MILPTIPLHLNFIQWSWLATTIKEVAQIAPVLCYELETLIIQDMYKRRLHAFTFYNDRNKMGMHINLQQYEAHALNKYLSHTNAEYNAFIRMFIEPKLIYGR
jgi:hypothetical protein